MITGKGIDGSDFDDGKRDLSAINEEIEISRLSSCMWNTCGQNMSKLGQTNAGVMRLERADTNEDQFKSIIERTMSTEKKRKNNYPHYNFNPSDKKNSGLGAKGSRSNEN